MSKKKVTGEQIEKKAKEAMEENFTTVLLWDDFTKKYFCAHTITDTDKQ